MKKFKFSLETVLKVKRRREEVLQRELAVLVRKLAETQAELAASLAGRAELAAFQPAVVKVDPANNLLLIKGALPGPNGSLLFVRKSITARVKAEE